MKHRKAYNLTLLMNTDGANVFESNHKSLWPIQFYLNFLPPSLRFNISNIIVGALYIGEVKPDVKKFFEPLGREIEKLQSSCLTVDIEGRKWDFNLSLTHSSFDLPAKAVMQNMSQYNGRYGCTYCLHPGKSTPTPKKISRIKYPWKVYDSRTNLDLLKTMEKMEILSKVRLEDKFNSFSVFQNLI